MGEDTIPEAEDGDVLLRVSYFGWGLRTLDREFGGDVIEDHTHHPQGGLSSTATFAFASLRKTLPLPDGGVFWSPQKLSVPEVPSSNSCHEAAVLNRLAAMVMKRAYLQGSEDDKSFYRQYETAAENVLLEGRAASMSMWSKVMLKHLPLETLRVARIRNYAAFFAAISKYDVVRIMGPEHIAVPAMAIIRMPSSGLRDALRNRLIEEGIYTAVLWPIKDDQAAWYRSEDLDFSRLTIAVHVDARYSTKDMRKVASRIGALAAALVTGK
jgi:hypothetical protein